MDPAAVVGIITASRGVMGTEVERSALEGLAALREAGRAQMALRGCGDCADRRLLQSR
jgi:hypothetical protein